MRHICVATLTKTHHEISPKTIATYASIYRIEDLACDKKPTHDNDGMHAKMRGTAGITSIPSSTSTVVSKEDDDSIDRTPSGPTLSMASAIMVPMRSSFPAEIEATAAL